MRIRLYEMRQFWDFEGLWFIIFSEQEFDQFFCRLFLFMDRFDLVVLNCVFQIV